MEEYKNYKLFTFVKIISDNKELSNKEAIVILNNDKNLILQLINNRENIELDYDNFKNIKLEYLDIYETKYDFNDDKYKIEESINIDELNKVELPNNYYKLTKKDWEYIYDIDDIKNSLYNYFLYKLPIHLQNNKYELSKINNKINNIIDLYNNNQLYDINNNLEKDVLKYKHKLLIDLMNNNYNSNIITPVIMEKKEINDLNYDSIYDKLYNEYNSNKIDINEFRERLFKLSYKEPEIPEDLSYYTLENIENDLNVIKIQNLDNLNKNSIKYKKLLGRKYDIIDQYEDTDIEKNVKVCHGTTKSKDFQYLSDDKKNTFLKSIKKHTDIKIFNPGHNLNIIGFYFNINNDNKRIEKTEKQFLSNTENLIYNPNLYLGFNLLNYYKQNKNNVSEIISSNSINKLDIKNKIILFGKGNKLENINNELYKIIPSLKDIFNIEKENINNISNILELSNVLQKYNIDIQYFDYNIIQNFKIQNILQNNISKLKIENVNIQKYKINIDQLFNTIKNIEKEIFKFIDIDIINNNRKNYELLIHNQLYNEDKKLNKELLEYKEFIDKIKEKEQIKEQFMKKYTNINEENYKNIIIEIEKYNLYINKKENREKDILNFINDTNLLLLTKNLINNDYILNNYLDYLKIKEKENKKKYIEICKYYVFNYYFKQYLYNNFINYTKNYSSNNENINNYIYEINKLYNLDTIEYNTNTGNIKLLNNINKSFDNGEIYYKLIKLIDLQINHDNTVKSYIDNIKYYYEIYKKSNDTNTPMYNILINDKDIKIPLEEIDLEDIKENIIPEYKNKLKEYNDEKEKNRQYVNYCKGYKIVKDYNSIELLNYDNNKEIYVDDKYNDLIDYKEFITSNRDKELDENKIKVLFNEKYPFVSNEEYDHILSNIEENIEKIKVKDMDYALLRPDTIYQRKDNQWIVKIDYVNTVCVNEFMKLEENTIEEVVDKMIILEKKEELKEESKEEPLCKSIEFDGECIPNRFYRYFISVYVLKSIVDDITNYENYNKNYSTIYEELTNSIDKIKKKKEKVLKINIKDIKLSNVNIPKEYQDKIDKFYLIKNEDEKLIYCMELIERYGNVEKDFIYWKKYKDVKMFCKHYLILTETIYQNNEEKYRLHNELIDAYGSDEGGESIHCKYCGENLGSSEFSDLEGFSNENVLVFREKVNYDIKEYEKEEDLIYSGKKGELYEYLKYICKDLGILLSNKYTKEIINNCISYLNNTILSYDDYINYMVTNESNDYIFSYKNDEWNEIKKQLIEYYLKGKKVYENYKIKYNRDINSILKYYKNDKLLKISFELKKEELLLVKRYINFTNRFYNDYKVYIKIINLIYVGILLYNIILISIPQYNIKGVLIDIEKDNREILYDRIIEKMIKSNFSKKQIIPIERLENIIEISLTDVMKDYRTKYNQKLDYNQKIISKIENISKWVEFKPSLYILPKDDYINNYISIEEMKNMNVQELYDYSNKFCYQYLYLLEQNILKNLKNTRFFVTYIDINFKNSKLEIELEKNKTKININIFNYIEELNIEILSRIKKQKILLEKENKYLDNKLIKHLDYLYYDYNKTEIELKKQELIKLYKYKKLRNNNWKITKRIYNGFKLNTKDYYKSIKKDNIIETGRLIKHINNNKNYAYIDLVNNEYLFNDIQKYNIDIHEYNNIENKENLLIKETTVFNKSKKNIDIYNIEYKELIKILNRSRILKENFKNEYKVINYFEDEYNIIQILNDIYGNNDSFINGFISKYNTLYDYIKTNKNYLDIYEKNKKTNYVEFLRIINSEYNDKIEALWTGFEQKVNKLYKDEFEIISDIGEYDQVDYNLNLLRKILLKEKYKESDISNIIKKYKNIEINNMYLNSNVLLIKHIQYLNYIILEIQNKNLDNLIKNTKHFHISKKNKKKSKEDKYVESKTCKICNQSKNYLQNKLSYYYPLYVKNKNKDIKYDYNIRLDLLTSLYTINEKVNEKGEKTIYKLINSYRLSLILKYILVNILIEFKNNNDIDVIEDLFFNIVNKFDNLYKNTQDDIENILKFKKADDNNIRKKNYDKMEKDRQKLQQMYRSFNIGDVYSDISTNYSEDYSNNTDIDNIQQDISNRYSEDKGGLDVFSNNYDENESLIMSVEDNDDNTGDNRDY